MKYQIVKRFGEAGFAIVNGEQVYFSNEAELQSLASKAPANFTDLPKTKMSMEDQLTDIKKHTQNKESGYVKVSVKRIWIKANKLYKAYSGCAQYRELSTFTPRVEKVNSQTCDTEIYYEWCEKPGDNKLSISAEECRNDYREYDHNTFLADLTVYVKVDEGHDACDDLSDLCKIDHDLIELGIEWNQYVIDRSKIKIWTCKEFDYLFSTYKLGSLNMDYNIQKIVTDAGCYAKNKVSFLVKESHYCGDDDDDPFDVLAKDR
jgi:hypothetical protein